MTAVGDLEGLLVGDDVGLSVGDLDGEFDGTSVCNVGE